jgi:8-oxo-dGTP diphosphatase
MKHVVVGVISRETQSGKEYLLMASKEDFGEFTGFFYPPGGHLEKGEDPKVALRREVREELSIETEPVREIAQSPGDVKDQITHWWECKTDNLEGIKTQDGEVKEIKWFNEEEIKNSEKIWPATRRFFTEQVFVDTETGRDISKN